MLRFVTCFLFCCALFCLLSCCWFCFVIVSPRLCYGAFLVVLLLTACVRNSDFFNKVDVNFNQSPLFVGDFSEKSNGNPGPSSSVAMSPTDGQLPTDPAQLKNHLPLIVSQLIQVPLFHQNPSVQYRKIVCRVARNIV